MEKYCQLKDEDLFEKVRLKDSQAFSELYDRFFGVLFVHAYNKLQNEEEAKDVVQEVFFTILNKAEEIGSLSNFSSYIYTLTRNRILNIFHHKKIQQKHLSTLSSEELVSQVGTDYYVREKDFSHFLQSEIDALPPKMREIFILSRHEYLTHKEIADKLQLSDKTVKRQISNALKIIRSKFHFFIHFLF